MPEAKTELAHLQNFPSYPDFLPIYAELAEQASIPAGEVQASDRVFHRGTGEGWAKDGDV